MANKCSHQRDVQNSEHETCFPEHAENSGKDVQGLGYRDEKSLNISGLRGNIMTGKRLLLSG